PRYTGTPRPLFTIGDATKTNAIDVTHKYGDAGSMVEATFTNGILSTQNLLQQLHAALAAQGQGGAGMPKNTQGLLAELRRQIDKPGGDIRTFLTGDVLSFVRRLLDRVDDEGGEIYLALYELHDPELIELLKSSVPSGRVHLILSSTGAVDPNPKGTPKADRKPAVWDTENNRARLDLHKLASKA